MTETPNPRRVWLLRFLALFVPFLSLFLLWRSPRSVMRKIIYTFGLIFYGIVYLGVIALLLVKFGGAQMDWRGGYIPILTWNKTHTDLEALNRSRATQTNATPTTQPTTAPPYWTGFRGPNRDGIYAEQPILTNWPPGGPKLLWKQPCGGGYSSFAIADGRAYTMEQRGENEVVVAYEVETGRELWTNGWPTRFTEMHSDEGPRTTPEYNDGRLYVLGAKGELRCLESTNGATVWRKNLIEDNTGVVPDYGHAGSPLVADDRIVVQNYWPKTNLSRAIVCYRKSDGQMLWHGEDMTIGYASPKLVTMFGERQVIIGGRPDVFALRLEDGVKRWSAPWHILNNERPIAQPLLLRSNRVMFSASYLTGATVFEISKTGDTFSVSEAWKSRKLKNRFGSSVLWEGYIYGLDEDILTCLDAETGETKWKDGRYGYGQIVLASGHLIIQCANGDLALVKATPAQHTELARVPGIKGKTWNYPAMAGGRLLIRNIAEMACFDLSVPK